MYLHQYHTFEEARLRLQTFLEDVYNAKRLHSLLDYVLPDEFELKYSMGSCLGGMGFLGALHNINCQKNCHSTSHKERCTCSIKARRRCRGNARWVENWSPPFGTLTKSTFFTQQFDYLQRSPDSPGGLSFRQMRAWEFIFTIEIHF